MKTNPRRAGFWAVAGGLAFVTGTGVGFSQGCPELVGTYWSGTAYRVAVSGTTAYLASSNALLVIGLSSSTSPVLLGQALLPGSVQGVAVDGAYAYVADYAAGLRVVDVSTPSAPAEVGFCDIPSEALGVAVSGQYAYVAAGPAGLRVVSVSTPSAPVEVGFCDTPDYALGVVISGAYAYVAAGYSGLRVVDVSIPSVPVEVGFCDTPGDASGVAISGAYAYVANAFWGLRVVDVSIPSAPAEVGFYGTSGDAHEVAVSGQYAFVADDAQPRTGHPHGVQDVSGQYALVARGYSGVHVVDVSTPSAPVEVGFWESPGYPWDVAVAGQYLFLADGDLRILTSCEGLLFQDGFDSGDTSAWSSVAP